MSVTIRPIQQADESRWKDLWKGYRTFYKYPVDADQAQALWERLMTDGSGVHGLAAEDENGLMVGFTHYLFHATTGDVRDKCYLQDLYVDPDLRVAGSGRALIEAVYQKGDEANVCEVYWMTQEFNSVARVLYDRVGQQTPFIKYRRPV